MSRQKPLMPKATAVWPVENRRRSFEQIAEFRDLHVLEVKVIADGDVVLTIKGLDPSHRQLTREEIDRAEKDPSIAWTLAESKVAIPEVKPSPARATRRCRAARTGPNAVLWLLRNHPELKDIQIIRLVGTTKPTIAAIRDRTHWNSPNLTPQDPVALGLCSQVDLDAEVHKAATRMERERKDQRKQLEKAGTLLPTSETVPGMGPQPDIDFGDVMLGGQRPVRTAPKLDEADDEPEVAAEESEVAAVEEVEAEAGVDQRC